MPKSKTFYRLEITTDDTGWDRVYTNEKKKNVLNECKDIYKGEKGRYRIVKEVTTVISTGRLS
jgi:hypothetical protein